MDVQVCPKCQHQNRTEARFCASCGGSLAPPPVQPTVAAAEAPVPEPVEPSPQVMPIVCPHCGQHNRSGAKRCMNCGQDLFSAPRAAQPTPILKQPILWIILAAIAGLIIISAAAYFIWDKINPFDDVEEIISPIQTVIGTLDMTSLPGAIETALPDVLPSDLPIGIPTDFPLEIPTLAPVSVPGLGIELPHLTDEQEIEIGREAAAEFENDNPISSDPALVQRVERIGHALLPYTPRQNLPYSFKVVDSDDINAFALPGGYIYVTRGMLEFVEEDHELAGVIGHELAHVALRHGAQLIENLAATQAALDAITAASPELDAIYQNNSTQLAIDAVASIVINGWGRENELDADEHGTVYMARATYHPLEIIDLFERMQQEGEGPTDPMALMFSTHPPFSDRIARVRQAIEEYHLGLSPRMKTSFNW